MKRAILCAVALLASCTGGDGYPDPLDRLIADLDADHSGTLTADEVTLREPATFAVLDEDKDGALSRVEVDRALNHWPDAAAAVGAPAPAGQVGKAGKGGTPNKAAKAAGGPRGTAEGPGGPPPDRRGGKGKAPQGGPPPGTSAPP